MVPVTIGGDRDERTHTTRDSQAYPLTASALRVLKVFCDNWRVALPGQRASPLVQHRAGLWRVPRLPVAIDIDIHPKLR